MKEKNIVIFTGQSGIKVKECIKRLIGKNNYISVDDKIAEISENGFICVLEKTYKELRELWSKAFEDIHNNIINEKTDELVPLTFHAVYYHQRKIDFFSPVDLNKIIQLKGRVKLVINFIDDIYDVYRRLMMPGEMYQLVKQNAGLVKQNAETPLTIISESIIYLMRLLDWRAFELSFSQKVAEIVEAPIYVIPAKYPRYMVQKLLEEEEGKLKMLYLSHPIRGKREDRQFQLEVNDFVKSAIKEYNIILFYPTGIDELRIKKNNGGYEPRLNERWKVLDENERISPPLGEFANINPFFPALKENEIPEISDGEKVVSSKLKILERLIKQQVTSRDYTLIEQAKNGTIVYRSFGSSDIESEVKYTDDLERKIILYAPEEDFGEWRTKVLLEELSKSTTIGDRIKEINTEKIKGELSKEKIQKDDVKNNTRNTIEKYVGNNYDFPDLRINRSERVLESELELERKKRVDDGWKGIYEKIKTPPILKKYENIKLTKDKMKPEDLVSEILKILSDQ